VFDLPDKSAQAKIIEEEGFMSKSIQGSKTEKSLLTAFAGESQARNRYTYYAGVAEKEGYLQIAELFQETAENEKEHAKRFFKFLEGGMLEIQAMYPAGKIGTTAENLKASAGGEHEEWTKLYPEAAKLAREEGFPEVAEAFENIAKVEAAHETRYLKLLANVEKQQVFKKSGSVKWKCSNCGLIHEGPEAPASCPACRHPQKYFELFTENY
jgi:rubrerythrin